MLTLDNLKDKKLQELIVKYRYAQIKEDYEYEYGDEYSHKHAVREASEAEHNLVEYIQTELIK
jgi:hypothetical protein